VPYAMDNQSDPVEAIGSSMSHVTRVYTASRERRVHQAISPNK